MAVQASELLERVNNYIPSEPVIQKKVVDALITLLAMRKQENYQLASISLLYEMEQAFQVSHPEQMACLHEMKKVAFFFGDLSDEQAEVVLGHLVRLAEAAAGPDSLEAFIREELKLPSETIKYTDVATRYAGLAMLTSALSSEDFSLNTTELIPTERLNAAVRRYFESRGYTVKITSGTFTFEKTGDSGYVTITNYSHMGIVMVSVVNRG